jgi:hypothetical protein
MLDQISGACNSQQNVSPSYWSKITLEGHDACVVCEVRT